MYLYNADAPRLREIPTLGEFESPALPNNLASCSDKRSSNIDAKYLKNLPPYTYPLSTFYIIYIYFVPKAGFACINFFIANPSMAYNSTNSFATTEADAGLPPK